MARGKLPIFDRHADDGRLMGYQVKIRKRGYASVTKQYDKLADAERFAIDTLKAMADGNWTDRRDVERTNLSEALDRYQAEVTEQKKAAAKEKSRIRQLKGHKLAHRSIASLRASDFAEYRDERLGEGLAGNSVRLDLALLRHLFTIGIKEWGWPVTNPIAAIRMPKIAPGRERRLSPEKKEVEIDGKKVELTEEERLLRACKASRSKLLLPIVNVAIETGMRRGELISMLWENVDLSRGTVFLPETKNGSERTVPLSPTAADILRQLLPGRGEATPLRAPTGRVFPLGEASVTHSFERACKAAGIAGLRFHDLRHEATSRLFERGFGIQQVAAITGHKTLQMLKRYTHLRAEDLAKMLAGKAPHP